MKLTFVVRTPQGELDTVLYRLPIKQEPFFDLELSWIAAQISYATQGIDLRAHQMVMGLVSVSSQPVKFEDWEPTAYRVAISQETYQNHRTQLQHQLNEIFNPTETDVITEEDFNPESNAELN